MNLYIHMNIYRIHIHRYIAEYLCIFMLGLRRVTAKGAWNVDVAIAKGHIVVKWFDIS